MRTDIETYELIERFLKNELSDSELSSFKNELATNPALVEEVATQQMIQEITIDSHLATIKSKTDQYNPYFNPSLSASKYKNLALALVTLLGTAGILFVIGKNHFTKNEPTPQEINPVVQYKQLNEELAQEYKKTAKEKNTTNKIVTTPTNNTSDKPTQFAKDESWRPTSSKTIEGEEVITKTVKETVTTTTKEVESDEKTVLVVTSKKTIRSAKDTVEQNNSFVKELKNIELKTPCHNEHFKVKISIIPSCTNDKNGQISIGKIEGGKSPYFVKLDNAKEFNNQNSFDKLAGGAHILYIQDADGCIYEHKINLITRDCEQIKK